ncbi:signal peptidase I [Candidatus Borkfalkia ceftriaxoniphila]|uniref:Signal peptidase I n=1 Tax=Candidatus Borkfalkia ceftriaxoniphila TaxID=2508949 RepID=A0A4Q2K5T1_9FIRM|nr:signal peptidase I [Candidatus Borkfalkia ceftriaxoniphila]RXZ58139.1 signal peptidase I [Candidatus Borkfalkia ceftriaxoniphila]
MEENENYGELIQRRRDPNGEMRSTARFLLVLLAIMFCVTILFTQIFNGVVVIGDSMKNTLYDGDYLYMNVSYTRLERGDIIVIDTHEKTAAGIEKYLIKRLIGLPGDSLYAEDGKLYRKEAGKEDFTLLTENYLPEEWDRNNEIASKAHPLILQENEIFFMGDNRNISEDSRGKYRNLTSEDVVGIVAPWSIACKGFLTALFNIF